MSEADAAGAASRAIFDAVRAAVDALTREGVATEPLADYIPARKVLAVFPRSSRLVEYDGVWRLGVFLVDAQTRLFATGETTRAVEPGWPQHHAQSAEQRREYRGAAMRGRFRRGQTINFNAVPIEIDDDELSRSSGPLFISGGKALVRWSRAASDESAMPFDSYLRERVELLCHPPEGA